MSKGPEFNVWTAPGWGVIYPQYKEPTPMSNQITAPWQNLPVVTPPTNADEDEQGIPTVVLPYKTPAQRAKLTLEKQIVIGVGTALLVGILEIIQAYAAGTVVDQKTLLTMFATLIVTVALAGLKKFADAVGEEGFNG